MVKAICCLNFDMTINSDKKACSWIWPFRMFRYNVSSRSGNYPLPELF